MASDAQPPAFEYDIDDADRIVSVSPSWVSFARENQAPELTPKAVTGRSVLEFVCDTETRLIYGVLFGKARSTGIPLTVKFRCDSPELRRFMELKIQPLERGGLRLIGRLLRAEPRDTVRLLDASQPRSGEIVTVCSWCKRVRIDEAWYEIEVAVERLHLFDEPRLPRLSHGICPECDLQMRREFGLREPA